MRVFLVYGVGVFTLTFFVNFAYMTIQDLLNAGFEMKMPIKNYLYGKLTELTEIKSTLSSAGRYLRNVSRYYVRIKFNRKETREEN